MRFPRALSIREDLSLTDCITASGAVVHSFGLSSFLLLSFSYPGRSAFREEEKNGERL
jgi:hypothetical protein